MRHLALLLIGLFLGGMGSMTALRALQARHAQPRALMTLIEQQQRRLQSDAGTASCNGPMLATRLTTLRTLTGLIDETFAGANDVLFVRYRQGLDAAVHDAYAQAASSDACAALHERLARIEDACDACHRDFR